MGRRRTLGLGALGIALLLTSAPWAQSQQAPAREITKIAGEVYRFRNANHYSIFAVTPAGVIATDPINADAARWLKAEIARRFNQPIRYVVYSSPRQLNPNGSAKAPPPRRDRADDQALVQLAAARATG